VTIIIESSHSGRSFWQRTMMLFIIDGVVGVLLTMVSFGILVMIFFIDSPVLKMIDFS